MRYLLFVLIAFLVNSLHAQCQLAYDGPLCANNPITFSGDVTGTTHNFDFNGEGTAAGNRVVKYSFKTGGTKKITYVTTIAGVKCTSILNLVIKTVPRIVLTKKTADTQCFENNLFCFYDSTYNPSGAKIEEIIYRTSYGQIYEYMNPVFGAARCFSFADERGGELIIYAQATDENGCVSLDTFENMGYVHPKIAARFTSTSPKNPGCDSTLVNFTNISAIGSGNVKSVLWLWGDGNSSDKWGPNLTYIYKKQGVFKATLMITAKTGCMDSFAKVATASVFASKINIQATADSVCISNSKVTFGVKENPLGITAFLWNFGDPASGPFNFNNRTLSPEHAFSAPGPFQIKFTASHPVCGVMNSLDTILVLGPQSVIESSGNRIPEHEVFQCISDKQDTVHFKNLSKFYHNDHNYFDDDSIVVVNGQWRHVFNSQQVSLKLVGHADAKNRGNKCAVRLWDFGDSYSPRCTTNSTQNINNYSNCRYSLDSLPRHYFSSWEKVFLSDYKFDYFEEGIFDDGLRSCSLRKIWVSDTFVIFEDTLLSIPAYYADSILANSDPYRNKFSKNYLHEKWFLGVGTRYIDNYVDIKISTGTTVKIISTSGAVSSVSGPAIYSLIPGVTLITSAASDSVEMLFTEFILRDTMPVSFLRLRESKGFIYTKKGEYVTNFGGTKGKDYIIDFNRFRQMFYAKIPAAFTVRLEHKDTCNAMSCKSIASKQISVMHADAGGFNVGLRQVSEPCFNPKTAANVTFILSELKPGANFSYMAINRDSNCSGNFITFQNFLVGSAPPYGSYVNYNLSGNPGDRFSTVYSNDDVCGENNCITVGIIIGNGVSKSGSRPLCADTQYYHNMLCFPELDPGFVIPGMKKDAFGNYKVCKGAVISGSPMVGNSTDPHDLKYLKWKLETKNAGSNYSNYWNQYVLEEYHFNQILEDSGNSKLYNYLVVSRKGTSPTIIPCSETEQDNPEQQFGKSDTIITAIISQWDTAMLIDKAWDSVALRLRAMGFDPFSLDKINLAKMVWNGKGVRGIPATGSVGCLDTTGFGHQLVFEWVPDPGYTKIIHYRDTSIRPLDSMNISGIWHRAYSFQTKFNGYHLMSLEEMATSGTCEVFAAQPVIVGFAASLEIPDSVVCRDQGTSLKGLAELRYFHPDPLNFGTWDPYDYWRDPVRRLAAGGPGVELPTKWDWNKADDDENNPQTIFSGGLYGSTGPGTPWKDLGGGGPWALYYKADSGVFTLRMASGDSSGCTDTITRRIFVTRLDVNFNLSLSVPSCNSVVEFFDSSYLFDPCKWANRNCQGGEPVSCDFVREWHIDWGDGKSNLYKRNTPAEEGLPSRIAHRYSSNGWFTVTYYQKTDQGCTDTFTRRVRIPGPRPKFSIKVSNSRDTTINAGDSITFVNLSDSASSSANFTWFFGDGSYYNTDQLQNVTHSYKAAGDFLVFLQQYDSLIWGTTVKRYCPAVYPDTMREQGFRIRVLPDLGLAGSKQTRGISIYPNPASEDAVIIGVEIEHIIIYSAEGREVFNSAIKNNKIPVSGLSPGCYVIRATSTDGLPYSLGIIKE